MTLSPKEIQYIKDQLFELDYSLNWLTNHEGENNTNSRNALRRSCTATELLKELFVDRKRVPL